MLRPRPVAALAILLALLVGAAARANRPPRFGDELTVGTATAATARYVLAADGSLQARDPATGSLVWAYRRAAGRPLSVVPVGDGGAVAAWSDGMLTAVQPGSPEVRWHRFVPGTGADARPVLAPLSGGSVLLVLAPQLVMVFRVADGSLRWDTQPPPGCAFDPARTVTVAGVHVLPRACRPGGTGTLEAFDAAGRRWRIAVGPYARPLPLDARRLAVRSPGPALRPYAVDAATGRRLPSCTAPVVARLAAGGGCADPAR